MRIVNMSSVSEQVKIVREVSGKVVNTDFVNVMPKKQVTLPDGYVMDKNWAIEHPTVRPLTIQEA